MAIEIILPGRRHLSDWGQLCIPDSEFFMGSTSRNEGRYLHVKVGGKIYQLPEFRFVSMELYPVIYAYEPVDLSITVKPIAK